MKRQLIGLSLAAAVLAPPAHAYNNREHSRLPDQAMQIANIVRRGDHLRAKVSQLTGSSVASLTARPSSVPLGEDARWNRFITEVKSLPTRMAQVRTGLPDPKVPASECGAVYPVLPSNGHLSACKAGDLPFAVKRWWASNTSDCFVRGNYFAGDAGRAEVFNELPTDYTGALLGYYGQAVDDEVNDSIWWFSTGNQLLPGFVKEIADNATEFGLGIALAPFACLYSLFSGDNCFDKARDWAHQANPVTRADQFAKDIEKSMSTVRLDGNDGEDTFGVTTTGVWHFINVENGNAGKFNRIGGLHYTRGGWRGGLDLPDGIGRMDALDITIVAVGDVVGLTLDPDLAKGVSRYQTSPDGPMNRVRDDWYNTIGHIEFEPLDNLALYGWRTFQTEKKANGLGWVLHAIGDAVAPHHGIAATGWGHRPFEDFAGKSWKEIFAEGKPEHFLLMHEILLRAYSWWKFIDDAQVSQPNEIPVRDFITALAKETRGVSDFALKAGSSLLYVVAPEAATNHYKGEEAKVLSLLQSGTGATLAFLVKAAAFVPQNDNTANPCDCPDGRGRDGGVCVDCASLHQVEAGGQCVATCPADLPILAPNGHCGTTCPSGTTCTGVSCAAGKLVDVNECVDACPAQRDKILDRECRDVCPPDYVVKSRVANTAPFFCERSFCTTVAETQDSLQACCPSNLQFLNGTTCVASCPASASFFVRATGKPSNCLSACPFSASYFVPSSGPKECLSQCPSNRRYGVSTTGGKRCETACPSSLPYTYPQSGFSDCIATCPTSAPFHTASNQCVTTCPAFHESNGLCVDSCPLGNRGDECNEEPR